jgi:NAD+ synthase (glutamine-hydrolysing)
MRLALAQINPTIGDLDGNAALISAATGRARAAGADLVVLPELAVSGYPPKDLLLQEGFIEACAAAAKQIGETATAGLTAVFGVPLPAGKDLRSGRIANSAVVYRDNRFVDYHDKRLLPTYDVFDEDRYFTPGNRAVVVECAGQRVGLAICEDLWKGEDVGFSFRYQGAPDPVEALAKAGATLIVSPSASPFLLGKGARHRALLARHAAKYRCFVASVNQVGGNDELIFDGHAAVFDPAGKLVAAGPGFVEHLTVVDLAALAGGPAVADPLLGTVPEELLFRAITLGIRDYCRKIGFKAAVVGISGGIDSAVVAALACAALGPANITGLIMPGRYSSEHSRRDAAELARRLGMRAVTIPIDPPFEGFHRAIDPAFAAAGLPPMGATLPDITEENIQSRARGTTLMAWSNRTGAIVLTTGNKSELAVGFATLYGDMNGGLAPISDVSKRQVYALARWINASAATLGFAGPPIPQSSIDKAPSAELRPNQTDQDTLPPYDTVDAIVERYVEQRQSPGRIIAETGLDVGMVARVVRMIDTAEFKRKQAAIGLKVTSVAFGSGRRIPIAQRWRAK